MTYRIAVVGVIHEAMLSCPYLTRAETTTILRGQEIIDAKPFLVGGMIDRLQEEPDVEVVPLIFAKTWPGGPFERAFYDAFVDEAQDLLRNLGPFDAVALTNHGAMEVEGLGEHGDTHFARAMRAVTGPDIPFATAFDHHGQVTPELLDHVTVFTALREAPHRDHHDASYRAGDLLMRCLRGEIAPVRATVQVPVLMPGEWVMTDFEPAHGLFSTLSQRAKGEGVLNAEILVGFAWNDNPWVGMQALVLADGDRAKAEAAALALAQDIWDARRGFGLHMETAALEDGLTRAATSKERPVYVSDSGDNTSAGAGGDLTTVLQACIAHDAIYDAVVAGIYAPDIVAQCHEASVGAEVRLHLGQEHASLPKTDMPVRGRVVAASDELSVPLGSGFSAGGAAWAVVSFGTVQATFHSDRVGISSPAHFEAMGLSATDHAIYVVKFGYLMPQLEEVAARHIVLLTEGCANLDLTTQTYTRVARPAFPLDDPETVPFLTTLSG